MAATLDDVVFLLAGMRSDQRSGFQSLEESVKSIRSGNNQNAPTPPTTTQRPNLSDLPMLGKVKELLSRALISIFSGDTLKKMSDGFTKVSDAAKKVLQPFDLVQKGLIGFGVGLTKFVSQINPAAVYRFDLAVGTLMATLGKSLAPVLDKVTALIHKLADAFASLSPAAKQMGISLSVGGALAAILGGLATAMRLLFATVGRGPLILATLIGAFAGMIAQTSSAEKLAAAFGRVLEAVGQIIESVVAAITPLVEAVLPLLVKGLEMLASALEFVASVIKKFLAELGIESKEFKIDKKGTPPLRPASFSSIEGFAKRAYSMAGMGSGKAADDPAKAALGVLKDIDKGLDTLPERIAAKMKEWTAAPAPEWRGHKLGVEHAPEHPFPAPHEAPDPPPAPGGIFGPFKGGLKGAEVGAVIAGPFGVVPGFAIGTMRELWGRFHGR